MATGPGANQIDWSAASHFVQSGQFEQAADLLQRAQVANDVVGNPFAVATLAAARQICLACLQSQADLEWYAQASSEAAQRHDRLRGYLQIIVDRLSVRELALRDERDILTAAKDREHEPRGLLLALRTFFLNLFYHWQERAALPFQKETPLPETPLPESFPPKSPLPETLIEPFLPENIPIASHDTSDTPSTQIESVESPIEQDRQPLIQSTSEPTVSSKVLMIESGVPKPDESATTIVSTPPESLYQSLEDYDLTVYCLGTFRVFQNDQLIEGWNSMKGQMILKYLITHRTRPIAKEVLMDLFWPDASPEAARNNLNVAIYSLRRLLRQGRPGYSHIVFQNDTYLLNPELRIWVDVEEFSKHFNAGMRLEQARELQSAIYEYREAEGLYQGEFFAEDRYDDWLLSRRQGLQDDYLTLLDRLSLYYLDHAEYDICIVMCNKILTVDNCREDTHRNLMRCYSRQGYHHLALRQYHLCVEALQHELEIEPDDATQALYRQIHQRQPV